MLCRLGHDVKAFASFNAFEHAIAQVVAIAKQNEGWVRIVSPRAYIDRR